MWSSCLSSIQTVACILSLFINESAPKYPKPEESAVSLLCKMQSLYGDIVIIKGLSYQDFLDELNYHFNVYSVSEEEYLSHLVEWREIYRRCYRLASCQSKLIEAAFSDNQFCEGHDVILSKAAYREISVETALALLHRMMPEDKSLGNPVPLNITEMIVQIANQYEVFKTALTVGLFNDFMSGNLSSPLRSKNNVAVALFVNGLKEAGLFHPGAFKRIGTSRCILSSTGNKTLTGREISSQLYEQVKLDEAARGPSGKYKGLKMQLAKLRPH